MTELAHYGVKGMKWGVRNDQSAGFRTTVGGPKIEASLHGSTQSAVKEVSKLMGDRYGFNITDVKDLKKHNPAEYDFGTVGYVANTPGQPGGTIFVRPGDQRKKLADAEAMGWFAPGTGTMQAMMTHEAAHAIFHADRVAKKSLFGPSKVVSSHQEARDKALLAASEQAIRDGINDTNVLGRISGYAKASGTREEAEAELFSQYHWGTNPPPFVQAWGQTLHNELGVDPTPFREGR